MTRLSALLAAVLLSASCGGQGSTSSSSPRPTAAPSAGPQSTSPSPSPSASPLTGTFGLLLSAGELELVKPDATLAANVAVANPSVQYCSAQHDGAVLAPPVSASSDQVYFRDGDTRIRMVVPPDSAADVTTVPGSASVISFFSVSPDDQRIAVLVEDLSGATTIGLRLYVEDLRGGGHHSDIYTATTAKGKAATTLWPMGWHGTELVLAVVPACSFEAVPTPLAWHLIDSTTARRMADIEGSNCALSWWPSAAGVACVDSSKGQARIFNWNGLVTNTVATQAGDYQSALSPNGLNMFFSTGYGVGAPTPATRIVTANGTGSALGHAACLFIDEGNLLAPDAVISYPPVNVTGLPGSGECAGRFPGGL